MGGEETIDTVIVTLGDGRQMLIDYTVDPPVSKFIGGWQMHFTPDGSGGLEIVGTSDE